jgi:hypothetical protein
MRGYRRLIVSPFLSEEGLDAVWPGGGGECTVVSRGEELDAVGREWKDWLRDYGRLRVLDENAAVPALESEDAGLRWSCAARKYDSGVDLGLPVLRRLARIH